MITRAGFIKRMVFAALASGMLGNELVSKMAVDPGPLPREGWTRLVAGEWTCLDRTEGNTHKTIWVQSEIDQNARIKPGDPNSLAVEFEKFEESVGDFRFNLRAGEASEMEIGTALDSDTRALGVSWGHDFMEMKPS